MLSSTCLQWPGAGDIDSFRHPALVERDREVEEIRNLVEDPRVRLLTLTGPAGVGKSRLAQEALSHSRSAAARSIAVDLADIADPEDAWRCVLAAFGERFDDGYQIAGPTMILDALQAAIGSSRTVLLLDNCDPVARKIAREVSLLLRRCPNLLLVATSRVVLNLQREYVLSVRPLRTRSDSGPSRPALSAATQLLLAGIDSSYRGSAANLLVLDEIAHEVDGVPLALELAAVTINRIGPAAALRLIRTGAGMTPLPYADIPARHRCTDDAVAWGLRDLDARALDVLLHLSLCESAVDPDTLATLAGLDESVGGATTLTPLIEHSLLRRVVSDAGSPSYELIGIVRAYCRRLLESDRVRRERIRREHVDRWHELARRMAHDLARPDLRETALTLAERHVGDFRATVAGLIEMGQPQRAVELAASLEEVWIRFGRFTAIESLLTDHLGDRSNPESMSGALELLGDWALRTGRPQRAIDMFTRAATEYRRRADAESEHRIAARLGLAHLEDGRPDLAGEQLLFARDHGAELGEVADIYLTALALPEPAGQSDGDHSRLWERIERLDPRDRLRAYNTLARGQLGAETAHRALELFRRVLRMPEIEGHTLETLTALDGCAAAYGCAGEKFGELAALLFGSVHRIRSAHTIPMPEDIGDDEIEAARLIRPETNRDLPDIVSCALSGPHIPACSASPLDALTKRQRQIALLVADGLTNRMIASRLGIAEWTVINHLRQVMAKLNCPSRLHVALVVKGDKDLPLPDAKSSVSSNLRQIH
ncbi:helix-turn-helix transcriptional regulator [Nocardia pseudobrasiliensis]|uniref:AAA domain-containing protein n=1 Tax=Nocardia pseudobrasiliensis TaxID=45979 RepID=A0A370I733_9NOCA|nr:LuxR C-terminal-related transcriptional regulator [Nocardia pseudobrasiliensis]RDI65134.1 AAA domain-containing protein [Nocardia pseudobrasiliensis]